MNNTISNVTQSIIIINQPIVLHPCIWKAKIEIGQVLMVSHSKWSWQWVEGSFLKQFERLFTTLFTSVWKSSTRNSHQCNWEHCWIDQAFDAEWGARSSCSTILRKSTGIKQQLIHVLQYQTCGIKYYLSYFTAVFLVCTEIVRFVT